MQTVLDHGNLRVGCDRSPVQCPALELPGILTEDHIIGLHRGGDLLADRIGILIDRQGSDHIPGKGRALGAADILIGHGVLGGGQRLALPNALKVQAAHGHIDLFGLHVLAVQLPALKGPLVAVHGDFLCRRDLHGDLVLHGVGSLIGRQGIHDFSGHAVVIAVSHAVGDGLPLGPQGDVLLNSIGEVILFIAQIPTVEGIAGLRGSGSRLGRGEAVFHFLVGRNGRTAVRIKGDGILVDVPLRCQGDVLCDGSTKVIRGGVLLVFAQIPEGKGMALERRVVRLGRGEAVFHFLLGRNGRAAVGIKGDGILVDVPLRCQGDVACDRSIKVIRGGVLLVFAQIPERKGIALERRGDRQDSLLAALDVLLIGHRETAVSVEGNGIFLRHMYAALRLELPAVPGPDQRDRNDLLIVLDMFQVLERRVELGHIEVGVIADVAKPVVPVLPRLADGVVYIALAEQIVGVLMLLQIIYDALNLNSHFKLFQLVSRRGCGRGLGGSRLVVLNLDFSSTVVQNPLVIIVADHKIQRCLAHIVEHMRILCIAVVLCDIRRGLDGHVVFPRLIQSRRFRPVEPLALRVVDQVVVFRPAVGLADVRYLNLPDSGFQIAIGGSGNVRRRRVVLLPDGVDGLGAVCMFNGNIAARLILRLGRSRTVSPALEGVVCLGRGLIGDGKGIGAGIALAGLRRRFTGAAIGIIVQGILDFRIGLGLGDFHRVFHGAFVPLRIPAVLERITALAEGVVKTDGNDRPASLLGRDIDLQAVCAVKIAALPFADANVLLAVIRLLHFHNIRVAGDRVCAAVGHGIIGDSGVSAGHF